MCLYCNREEYTQTLCRQCVYDHMEEAYGSSNDPFVIKMARRVMSMLNSEPPNGWTPGYQRQLCAWVREVMKKDLYENEEDSDYNPSF